MGFAAPGPSPPLPLGLRQGGLGVGRGRDAAVLGAGGGPGLDSLFEVRQVGRERGQGKTCHPMVSIPAIML